MPPIHQMTWNNFCASIFVSNEVGIYRIEKSPQIEIFGDGIKHRIGLWLEVPSNIEIPDNILKLVFIESQIIKNNNLFILELSVSTPAIYRNFYHFAIAVSERIMVENKSAIEAVSLELQSFAELLEVKPLLSTERQIGLIGELIILERLLKKNGSISLDAWIGPLGEPHDFRLGNSEFEVKTTVRVHRIHTIHGSEQLIASEGCSLFILSILLGPGGDEGFSLVDIVNRIFKLLLNENNCQQKFVTTLEKCGFYENEKRHYSRRFSLRRPIALIPVDMKFPAITRKTIQAALGPLAARIESLQYDVNMEGLEYEDSESLFAETFKD